MMATSGMLGYGFTEEAFRNGLESEPDFIACDCGSMDPGPYYLGAGVPFVSRAAVKRDLSLMIEAGIERSIPVLLGSAGGAGGDPHIDWTMEIVREIAADAGLHFKAAVIRAEQDKGYLKQKLEAGAIEPLGPIDDLTTEEIDRSHRVVAMMGAEPFQAALAAGADLVVAGRSSDAAIYAAIPTMQGADPGLAWHLAKVIECGAQVAEPRTGQDCILGTLADDHFTVEPGHPEKRCTRMRVAAHTLYENPSPHRLIEPDGVLDTSEATYEQLTERSVMVKGSRFERSDRYTVKLEGVRRLGFRTAFIAGVRDPGLVDTIDDFIAACRGRVAGEVAALGIGENDYRLGVRVYGKNATMGAREPVEKTASHELGILADVIADDEETSRTVLAKARYALLHTDFPGRMCISGNLAVPFSPSDFPVGEAYEFTVWHTMALDDPLEPFPIEMVEI